MWVRLTTVRRHASTVITLTLRTPVRHTAITARNGSWAACLSAQARGITGITATPAGMDADGAAVGITMDGAAGDSAAAGIMMGVVVSSTATEDFTAVANSTAVATSTAEGDFTVAAGSMAAVMEAVIGKRK